MSIKKTIFNLKNNILRQPLIQYNQTLMANENMTTEQIESLQLEKLKKLFVYSKAHIPYYKEKFKNIEAKDINTLQDWEKLPILTKADILDHAEALKAPHIPKKRFSKIQTGGSTGKPLVLFHDKNFFMDAVNWRVLKWWGVKPSDNAAYIQRRDKKGLSGSINHLIWYPTQRIFLNVSHMTEENLHHFYKELVRKKPTLLQGYVAGVFEFAKFCQKNNYSIDFLKAIWVTAAPLPEPSRTFIEGVFKAPVYDQYGCAEVFWISAQCSHKKGLHVMSDIRYVEILDKHHKPMSLDMYGEITITDLENYVFPLIRYKNGDRGRFLDKKCTCGSHFPPMDKIDGRISDIIKLKSGKIVSAHDLTTLFDNEPEKIRDFQIYQHKDHSITLFCVLPYKDSTHTVCEQKVIKLKELTNNEVPIHLKITDNIGHDDGKTRFVISKVR